MLAFGDRRLAFPDNGGRQSQRIIWDALTRHGKTEVRLMAMLKMSFPYQEFLFCKVLHVCVPHQLSFK